MLDFGGVISRTLFETHDLTERALGLAPGTLTWRGPFAPETDAAWREMQAGGMTERDYWALRMRETGALVGEDWTAFPQFIARVRGDDPGAVRERCRAEEEVDDGEADGRGGCLGHGRECRDRLDPGRIGHSSGSGTLRG